MNKFHPMLTPQRILTPRDDPDRRRDDRELLLEAPFAEAELITFVMNTVSPLDKEPLRELAEALREVLTPHVHTALTRGIPIIRPDRPVDEFDHKRALAEMQLGFAFTILGFTARDKEQCHDFLSESDRLCAKAMQALTTQNPANLHPRTSIQILLSVSFRQYYAAAFNAINSKKISPKTRVLLKAALNGYVTALSVVHNIRNVDRQVMNSRERIEELGEIMAMILRSERIAGAPPGTMELMQQIYLGDHESSVQEILFGMARCYALLGDKANLDIALTELEYNLADPENRPAPPLLEWLELIKTDAAMMDTIHADHGFISPSPQMALEKADSISRKYGGRLQRIYLPGQ